MSDSLKVGILGCGIVSGGHIRGFMRLKGKASVQAVCDKNENLAKQVAQKFGISSVYTDLSDMLSKEKLDIVDICTPPQAHAPLALIALEQGCNVLMEKPMALKVTDCDQMIDAAKKYGVKVGVVHNILFETPFLKARKLVSEGAIGDFIGMRIFMSDPSEDMIMRKDHWIHKLPGGLVGESGPHPVYMSLAFLNKVKSADIFATNFLEHPWAPFDEFRIELEGEKAISSIAISYASNRRNLCIDILGTEAALYIDIASIMLIRQRAKESMGPAAFVRYLANLGGQVTGSATANAFKLATGKLRYGHATLIEKYVQSILDGSQLPVTGEDGRETVKVMEMIVEKLYKKYGDSYKIQQGNTK